MERREEGEKEKLDNRKGGEFVEESPDSGTIGGEGVSFWTFPLLELGKATKGLGCAKIRWSEKDVCWGESDPPSWFFVGWEISWGFGLPLAARYRLWSCLHWCSVIFVFTFLHAI